MRRKKSEKGTNVRLNVQPKRPVTGVIILISLLVLVILFFGVIRYGKSDLKSVYQTKKKPADVTKQLDFGSVKTFEDVYDGIALIDQKYGISFKKEVLFGRMVNKDYIPSIKSDLNELRKKLDPAGTENVETYFSIFTPNRTEQQLGLLFIDARRKMIESQEKFHQAYSSGTQGLVGDGFSCREEPIILASITALNESAQLAVNAKYYFDELLTDSEDITWEYVGVNDDRPAFYNAPSEFMWAQLKVNRAILREYCHSDIHTNKMPRESRSVTFDPNKHKDLFINPRRTMSRKQWQLFTASLNPSASSSS